MGREWQFDYGRASETLRRGKPAETGRLYLTSLNHSFTLDVSPFNMVIFVQEA